MQRSVTLALALCLLFLISATASLAAQPAPLDTDHLKAIWSELTPQERAAYDALMEEQNAREQAALQHLEAAVRGPILGDTCTPPDSSTVALPYLNSSTTTGTTNNYDLNNAAANGDCGSGQTTFTGTGAAPDVTYSIETDINCTLSISADPTTAWDLALYVVQSTCTLLPGFVNNECIALDDNGGSGTAEVVTLNAVAGTQYYIIIDGFNAAVGPYDLAITEVGATGCNLVPVELMNFSID